MKRGAACIFFFLIFTSSAFAQTLTPSKGWGTFIQGLTLENTLEAESYPSETAWMVTLVFDSLENPIDTAWDFQPLDGFAAVMNFGNYPPGAICAAGFYDTENNFIGETPEYPIDMRAGPSWLDSAWVLDDTFGGTTSSWSMYLPIALDVIDYLPSSAPGLGNAPFGMEFPGLAFSFELDHSTGQALVTDEGLIFQFNALELNKEFYGLDLSGNVLVDADYNIAISADAIFETSRFDLQLFDARFPVTPGLSIGFDAGLEFYLNAEGHVVFGSDNGQWGFISSEGQSTGLAVTGNAVGYVRGNVRVLGGVLKADAALNAHLRLGAGLTYTSVPTEAFSHYAGGDFHLTGEVTLRAFSFFGIPGWELAKWGPKSFYSTEFGSLPELLDPLYEESDVNSIIETYRLNEAFVLPEYAPQPLFSSTDQNSGTCWVDNLAEISTLQFSVLDAVANQFEEPIIVAENNRGINSPDVAFLEDGSAFIVYCQSRLEKSQIGTDVSFQDLYQSQDIFLALYDDFSDSIVYNAALYDDFSSSISGRAESTPLLATNGTDFTLIVWIAENGDGSNDLWYATLQKEQNTWNLSQPEKFTSTGGSNHAVQLEISPSGDAYYVTWINDADGEHSTFDSKVMLAEFTDNAWGEANYILDFGPAPGKSYEELAVDFNENFWVVATTVLFEDENGKINNRYELGVWDGDAWELFEHTEDSVYSYFQPSVSINESSVAAISIQKITSTVDPENIDQGAIELYVKDLNQSDPWKYIDNNALTSTEGTYFWDMDLEFASDNNLYILSQETDTIAGNEDLPPANGIVFGAPELNMVLRGLSFDENLDATQVLDLPDGLLTNIYKPSYEKNDNALRSVYPNPAKESGTIEYRIQQAGNVRIDLLSLDGQQLQNFQNTFMSPGTYQAKLNFRQLDPGFYILKLSEEHRNSTQKVIITQ